jgi:hypothetical protein
VDEEREPPVREERRAGGRPEVREGVRRPEERGVPGETREAEEEGGEAMGVNVRVREWERAVWKDWERMEVVVEGLGEKDTRKGMGEEMEGMGEGRIVRRTMMMGDKDDKGTDRGCLVY